MSTPLHIIKIGGKLINDDVELTRCLEAFDKIEGHKILVHGGGRKATELSDQLDIEVKIIDGRRITSAATLEVAIMVFAGLINKTIVARLQARDVNALGLSGADGDTISAVKRPVNKIDYGYVGDIKSINISLINTLLANNVTPVFCALSHDRQGQMLNTNADTIAAQLAIALSKKYDVTLSYCFEYKGVLLDISDPDVSIGSMSSATFEAMKKNGAINSGMIPKLSNGFDALKEGVSKVAISGIDNLLDHNGATLLSLK